MKKFLFVLLMLGVVAVGVVFLFLEKLDGIVKNKIEVIGTETLGQTVKVGGVNIKLKDGMGEITGLTIANPQGFADAQAFVMDRIRLALDLGSLSKNPLVLNEFILESPVVSLDIREDGTSNLDEIIQHLKAQQKEKPAKSKEEAPAEPKAEAEPLFFAIKELKIAGVQLTVRHPKLGEEAREYVLPDIDLQNVGGETGVSPAKLGEVVVEAIAKSGAKQALQAEVEKQKSGLLKKAKSSMFKKLGDPNAPAAE